MPLYHHKCSNCGTEVEELRRLVEFDNFPVCCDKPMELVLHSCITIMDIQPYQAVAADKETGERPYIRNRREHKEFLRRNNYEELGNENIGPKDEG